MPFSPDQFAGRPLPDLLADLAGRPATGVSAAFAAHARRPKPPGQGGMLPPTVTWRTAWLPPQDPAATLLAPTHPDVSAADVTLGEYLGGGTQGAVYAGTVRSTGLVVAVKVIRTGGGREEAQAVHEARIGAKLRHPNILRVFDARPAGEFWVVVMEFLQGDDLSAASPAPRDVPDLALGLAGAVRALAAAGVVHRDIKPANVVRRRADGAPVLIDFGVAVDLATLTEHPGIGGTPLYMAPEALTPEWPSAAWDAYSLGMTVVALTERDRLPRAAGVIELMAMKSRGEFDRHILGLLRDAEPTAIRAWCAGLIGPAAGRLVTLMNSTQWLRPAPGA